MFARLALLAALLFERPNRALEVHDRQARRIDDVRLVPQRVSPLLPQHKLCG